MEPNIRFEKPVVGENPMEPDFVAAIEKREQAAAEAYFEEMLRQEENPEQTDR